MNKNQQEFIQFALDNDVLKFGKYTLKSGRLSPYFFNAGLFNSGLAISKLGKFYAQAIVDSNLEFDVLFGPAYKGIPLACTTAIALAEDHGRDVPWCFNRKEVKTHGEGGQLVGAELNGRVLVIDDVITAGTAINEAYEIIYGENATFAGVVIAVDRQEKGKNQQSAIQEVEGRYDIDVVSVANLSDLITFLSGKSDMQLHLSAIEDYRRQYGV